MLSLDVEVPVFCIFRIDRGLEDQAPERSRYRVFDPYRSMGRQGDSFILRAIFTRRDKARVNPELGTIGEDFFKSLNGHAFDLALENPIVLFIDPDPR